MIRTLSIASVLSFAVLSMGTALAQEHTPAPAAPAAEKKPGPADGFNIHVMAPHKFEDGTVHGPYHHYCKSISPEVLQCLLFESTDPNARLTDVEYFVAKSVSRAHVPLKTWNKYYHDHEVEIATGRVQVLSGTCVRETVLETKYSTSVSRALGSVDSNNRHCRISGEIPLQ